MLHRMNLLLTPPKEQQRSRPFLFWNELASTLAYRLLKKIQQ